MKTSDKTLRRGGYLELRSGNHLGGRRVFLELSEYLYTSHSEESAGRKVDELLTLAMSLSKNPARGRIEDTLAFLEKEHRFLVYQYTSRKSIMVPEYMLGKMIEHQYPLTQMSYEEYSQKLDTIMGTIIKMELPDIEIDPEELKEDSLK